jgi:hypothetical protein
MIGSTASALTITNINPGANAASQLNYIGLPAPFTGSTNASGWGAATGYTGAGTPVVVSNRNTSGSLLTLAPIGNSTFATGTNLSAVSAITTALSTNIVGVNPVISAIPHIGEAVLIGYSDNNQCPAFVSIAALPFTVSFTLTAGTDVSATTLSLTQDTGYSLQGISITAAASGSSGLVQTRGTAALNSNYSAATPATLFDFRNPIASGASGTVIGRTVIMGNN